MPKYIPALTVLLFFFMGLAGRVAGAGEGGGSEPIDRLNLGMEKYYAAQDFFYRQRDPDKAVELLEAAEELFGGAEDDYARSYWLGRAAFLKARIKTEEGKEEEATEAFLQCEAAARSALACDRGASEALRLLGEALVERNKNDSAFAWAYLPQAFLLLEKAAVLDRENRVARSALAGYYLEAPLLLGEKSPCHPGEPPCFRRPARRVFSRLPVGEGLRFGKPERGSGGLIDPGSCHLPGRSAGPGGIEKTAGGRGGTKFPAQLLPHPPAGGRIGAGRGRDG